MAGVKAVSKWVEAAGISLPPWINCDWQSIVNLLSRLLADPLVQKKQSCAQGCSTLKLSFNSLRCMAEELLGIPLMILEIDFDSRTSNLRLALLAAVICIKSSVDIEPKSLERIDVSNAVIERNETAVKCDDVLKCTACHQQVFLVQRVIVEEAVYHRKCFKCSVCHKLLHRYSSRQFMGNYECFKHLPVSILYKIIKNNEHYLGEKPVPPPKPTLVKKYSSANVEIVQNDVSNSKQMESANNIRINDADVILCPVGGSVETVDGANTRPVPPPRPKRKSLLLLEKQVGTPESSPRSIRSSSLALPPVYEASLDKEITENRSVDYPDFLNPFGTADEADESDADSCSGSLNPLNEFLAKGTMLSAVFHHGNPRKDERKIVGLRPKDGPPPPPKPPRTMKMDPSLFAETAVEQMGSLTVTEENVSHLASEENKSSDLLPEEIMENVAKISADLDSLEDRGIMLEEEILAIIEKGSSNWLQQNCVTEWVEIVQQHCVCVRQQAMYIKKWMEEFLNQIHAETEVQLRHLIENVKEKSDTDVKREAELLELLVDIIDQKSYLVQTRADGVHSKQTKTTRANAKLMKHIKTRLKRLKKIPKRKTGSDKQ